VIAALAVLRGRHPDLRYVLVGEGPERERLRARAIELGVADRVELLGRLAPPEAVAVARAGSLFVLPSVAEAFGVAYVEAMAGGVPAIGSRGEEGPEEIAAAGGGIALVPAGDVNALAAQIDTLLSNPPALEAMGQQARENVEREFTWEKCGRETLQAYEQALAEE
jgi:glycosyltransferase involved in cell wall biosynthesis